MKTKICFKCEIEQPVVSFYKHPEMGDGRLGKCKSCTRYDVRTNYKAKVAQYRQYDRDRYAADPKKRRPKPRTGLKYQADVAFHNATARGKIVKQPCVACGNPKSEGHHMDYAKPLDVMWLCRQHHRDIHRFHSEV